mgnify:CR=1 FL=1
MTIKDLQTEMIAAMKAKEKNRKATISGLIAAVKKDAGTIFRNQWLKLLF